MQHCVAAPASWCQWELGSRIYAPVRLSLESMIPSLFVISFLNCFATSAWAGKSADIASDTCRDMPSLSMEHVKICCWVSSIGVLSQFNGQFVEFLYIFEKIFLIPLTHWDLMSVSICWSFAENSGLTK